MSSLSEPFIRRPIATTLLTFGLGLAGALGYSQLPVAALPQVDYPTIVVSTGLPGASPETMASSVTTPLERQFGQMPSLGLMTSVSGFATSRITLQFNLDRNIDAAEQDVQAAINAASALLPPTLPAPPTYAKQNPADAPVMTLSVRSDSLSLAEVADYADSVLAQKLSQVAGVGLVAIGGGQKPAVRVQVDPVALAGAGLTLEDVRLALAAANVNAPKGNLDGPRLDYTLSTNDQLGRAASFRSLLLAWRNGAPLRLDGVAHVIDGVENAQLAAWADRSRAVILGVQRQPGANVIAVADGVKALLPRLAASMPQAIEVRVLSDRTATVRASVADVQQTLLLTIALVVLVMYVFLRSLRATVIPGVAVPMSLVATFGVMHLFGFSLNNLSLMALTISTGFVVDDAIVMVENVERHIEEGLGPIEAALRGARQIGFTIVSLTVSLVAVLIPLLFMGGLVGRLFREFAITLAIAIIVSAVLSLTLTAMMCAHLLSAAPTGQAPGGQRGHLVSRAFELGFAAVLRFYERTLDVVLAHRPATMIVTLATIALTALLALIVPKGFFPSEDTGLVVGISEAAPDISFARMMDRQQALAEVLLQDPAVLAVASTIGSDGVNTTANSGRFNVTLAPRERRMESADAVIARLGPRLAAVSGITVHLTSVQDLQIDNRPSRAQYQYTLEHPDPSRLRLIAPRIVERLRALPELADVTSDQQDGGLGLVLTIDRDTAARLGVSAQAIDDTLYDAFGQRIVSTVFTQLNLYRVILEVRPEDQQDPSALERVFVRSLAGAAVPLSSLSRFEEQAAPLLVSHQGQFPAVTISWNPHPGVSLGAAVEAIRAAEATLALPPGTRADFEGTARVFREALASEPALVFAALLTVYVVLGVLYESYIHPITILSTLPSAGVGAFAALLLGGRDFDVIALIGIILLVGIVKKNAIMMIDFALEAERVEQLSAEASIRRACLLRFRPIMMTTVAALLGALPLALGGGTGSELRRPLGVTVVGGLLVSQIMTLYTTPVIYLYMDRIGARLRRRRSRPAPAVTPLAGDAPE